MAHIEGEIVINRPVEDVFDVVADEQNEPRYNPTMQSVERVTDGSIGPGTQFRVVSMSMGQPVEMIIELTRVERPSLLASTTHMDAMEIEGELSFTPVPGGTRLHWSWEVTPHGIYRLMGPVVARLGGRREARIWAGLKRHMEQDMDGKSSSRAGPTARPDDFDTHVNGKTKGTS